MQKEILKELLHLLDPDEALAAVEYQRLHERLSRFFEWNNAEDPNALADEALDRLGRRASESGLKEGVQNASAFALGVARHLLQEEARRQQRATEAGRQWRTMRLNDSSNADSPIIEDALQHCMAQMRPERRRLIEAYYSHSGGEKIKMHQQLAEQEGLSLNALRNRALRTRQELEACIRRRLGKSMP